MSERILLIVPRWMPKRLMQDQIADWRALLPQARFTLLAAPESENSVPDGVEYRPLPPVQAGAVLRFAWRLRRRRFDRAVALADSGRGDVGYGEAKFWALISRARRREWSGQSLSLLSEARAKKPLVPLFFVRTLSKIKGIRPRDDAAWRGAQTFVYLQHATQRGLQSGRVLLLGGEWDEAAARRCGWQAVARESAETLSLILCDAQCPAELLARLEPGGLLCCRAGAPSGWRVLEERPAFFQPESRDVWLVRER